MLTMHFVWDMMAYKEKQTYKQKTQKESTFHLPYLSSKSRDTKLENKKSVVIIWNTVSVFVIVISILNINLIYQ